MNTNSRINVLCLGLGQQGLRTLDKLDQLKEAYPISIIGIADLSPERIKEAKNSFPELLQNTQEHLLACDAIDASISETNLVLISTWTQNHEECLTHIVDMARKTGSAPKAIGCEKPVFLNRENGLKIHQNLDGSNILLGENLIELFSPSKQATIKDLLEHNGVPLSISSFRGGPVKGKSIAREKNQVEHNLPGNGGIYGNFVDAHEDKLVHDIGKGIETLEKLGEPISGPSNIQTTVSRLKVITPDGKTVFFTDDGEITSDKRKANICYSNCGFEMKTGEHTVRFRAIGSWIDISEKDLDLLDSFFTPEVIKAVRTAVGQPVNLMPGKPNWDQEARVEQIVALVNGKKVTYVTSTLGVFFTTRQVEGQEVEVLQHGGADFHLNYVENMLKTAAGHEKPFVGRETILESTKVIEELKTNSSELPMTVLDLRNEPEELSLSLGV